MSDHDHSTSAADADQTSASADNPSRAHGDDPSGPNEGTAALRRERDDFQDRWMRTTAEFDNFRKRIERERKDLADFVSFEILLEILPVIDDLERALQANAGDSVEGYRRGVELIHKRVLDMLRKRGVSPIDATGKDFDPHIHQAVAREVSERYRDGEVIEEMQRGYLLGDKLLRPTMVKVATRE